MINVKTPRILVVDDEPDIRRLVCEILEDEGYQVAMAEDASAARQLKKSQQPDLILLDIWMPDMDGIECTQRIRLTGGVPIVMVTARDSACDIETAIAAGANAYVVKPVSIKRMMASFLTAVHNHSFEHPLAATAWN